MKKIIVILSILLCLSEKRVEASSDWTSDHPYAVWGTVAAVGTVVLGYCAWKAKSWCQSPVVVPSGGKNQQPTEHTPLMRGHMQFLGGSGTPQDGYQTPLTVSPQKGDGGSAVRLLTGTRTITTTQESFVVVDVANSYGSGGGSSNLLVTPSKEKDSKTTHNAVFASPATRAVIANIQGGNFNVSEIIQRLNANSTEKQRIQGEYDTLTSDIDRLIAMAEKVKAETAQMRDKMLSSGESAEQQKKRAEALEKELAEKKVALESLLASFKSK